MHIHNFSNFPRSFGLIDGLCRNMDWLFLFLVSLRLPIVVYIDDIDQSEHNVY